MTPWRDAFARIWNRITGQEQPRHGFRHAFRALAGPTITHENAFTLPAFYRGAALVSSAIAQLPWQVYRRGSDGKRERMATHGVEWLLQNAPNDEMTAFSWRQTTVVHALTAGNAYSEIEWDNRGSPRNLWPLVPERVQVVRDDRGRLFYRVWNPRGTYADLASADMFHVHGMGWDGISGFDTVGLAGESLGVAKALEEFAGAFFGNGANPGLVVQLKNKPTPEGLKRMREELDAMHGGPRRAGKTAFTEVGAEVERLTTPPDQSQFLESRQYQIGEASRWIGARPHLLGDLSKATNNNIEHQSREFLLYDLLPWVLIMEQEANRKLFGQNRAALYTKMNVNAFLRGDMAARAAFYKDLLINGIASVNDIRGLEDWDEIGPEGDVHMVQGQMMSLKDVGKQKAAAPPDPGPAAPGEDDDGEAAAARRRKSNGAANGTGLSH